MKLFRLYSKVVSCSENCSGIIKDNHTNIPRGFFTQAVPGDKIIALLVAQNPGQPMRNHGEWMLYENINAIDAVKSHLNFVKQCFFEGKGKPFHKRLVNWMADLLQIPESQVFKSVVYTNIVKCTTPKNKVPPKPVVLKCANLHLRREIKVWNPKFVIALGGKVQERIEWCGIDYEFLPHPSHREESNYHKLFLQRLKKIL